MRLLRWFAFPLAAPLLSAQFAAGVARRDITPKEPTPMWGYGDRHDALSTGTIDPLFAEALVVRAGDRKLAIVGLDLADEPGKGKGKFDATLRYYTQLEDAIVAAVVEANSKLVPARLATGVV